MTEEQRLFRIFQILERSGGLTDRLCEVSVEVTGVTGAGIMLMEEGPAPLGSICSSDAVSARLESLQFSLAEGPCVDAHRQGSFVSEPDLAAPEHPRWLAFTPGAVQAGARAIFGVPLRRGETRLGALNLYRNRPGALSEDQLADAEAMAEVAAGVILVAAASPASQGAADLFGPASELHLVVHQAVGMISVQVGASVGDAMARLRAAAFAAGRSVDDLAADVVARRTRFGPASDT